MTLIIDECVPASVAQFFRDRGHDVYLVTDILGGGVPDPVVAWAGNEKQAIIITWDSDFQQLISRIPKGGGRNRYRKCGRINFKGKESRGVELAEKWIESIEFEFRISRDRHDKRVILDIMPSGMKIHR
jgi:uncharacterized protein DUF5615